MPDRSYYVETSVWGMIPKGQPKELRQASLQFLRQAPSPNFFISPVVLREIIACSTKIRSQIMVVLKEHTPTILEVSEECEELAQFYVDSGILPAKKTEDALHVALATIHQMDILVSWNHRHMANVRKAEQYQAANRICGYRKTPLILTPLEVMHE